MTIKTINKIFSAVLFIIIAGIFSCQDPSSPITSFTVTVSGQVLSSSGVPQDSVQLILFNPFRNTDTTKADGTFHYTFTSEEKNEIVTTMRFHHVNNAFFDSTVSVSYSSSKKSIAIGEMKMKNVPSIIDTSSPPRFAKFIKFISSSFNTISIRGAGKDVTNLIFEVGDSLGIPVDTKNSVSVSFRFIAKPDSLVEFNHSSVLTNSKGQVIVQLSSGVKAGQAQLQAIASVKNSIDTSKIDTIKSEIVTVVIAGGLPVPSRFTISSDKVNLPGMVKFGLHNTITAIVGDTFGNPVQQGTLVSFTTTGGVIQPSAATSIDGVVSVDLITGNQFPANGLAVIAAQVGTSGTTATNAISNYSIVDDAVIIKGLRGKQKTNISPRLKFAKTTLSSSTFFKTINVLFSGEPRILSNDSIFSVPSLGTKQIQFTVDDINGNPMSQGTTIKVTGIGLDTTGAVLSGDVDNTLPDTDNKNYTKFNISIADKRTKNLEKTVPILLNIEVAGPNGNIKKTFSGVLAPVASDTGKIGSITMLNSAVDTVVVNGAGSPTSSTVQVKVLNVNGNPSANVPVTFAFTKTVGGGEYLSSLDATPNSSGIATVTFNSGIRSGLVQVQATVKENGILINSDIKSIYVKTGVIATLNLVSASTTSLSVKGGGGNESAVLIFEAKDVLGNTIDGPNQTNIILTLQGDTAGARVNPSTVKTDQNTGRVTTNITSGTRSGIILVTAQYGTVKSTPVPMSISGGQPVVSRFTLSTQKVNLPGGVQLNLSNTITAVLGDTFGNPVHEGTVVSFSTNGGIIQPSATTSNTGLVSVGLVTGNPFPPAGIATVTAEVGTSALAAMRVDNGIDEAVIVKPLRSKLASAKADGKLEQAAATTLISKSINIVFSGVPRIASNDSVFVVSGLGTKQIQFTVDDINGNPMSQGTTIKVTGIGLDTTGAVLSGDVDNTLPDTDNKNYTKFNISIADKRTKNLEKTVPILLNIEVAGPNGSIKKTFSGVLAPVASDTGKIGSITMVNSAVDTVVVNGAGSPTSSTVQVKVLNVNGNPSASLPVIFAFTKTVGGGEYLSSLDATTNSSGIATVIFNSGIRSGLVQVQATVKENGILINSDIKSIYVKTGVIASLNLVSASTTSLSVKGGGGNESAVLIFEAKDVLGNTIDGPNQANIILTLQGDTAGARVNPSTVKTDQNTGRVTTNVTAGTQSGIILVTAKFGSIFSAVQIAVSGGLPDQSQFTLSIPKKNYSILTDKSASVSVTVGDAYRNPVKSGTLIKFKSNGGLIDNSAVTNSSGFASASLQIVNPQPPSGFATIEAETFGVGGVVIRDTQSVVFSRDAIIDTIIGGPYSNFVIEDGLSKTFQYSIFDINGNPLAQGNTISVQALGTGSANIILSGDINVTTSDTKNSGVGTTQFSFTARDAVKGEGQGSKPLSFKISVVGPNTSGVVSLIMNGTLKGGASADSNHFTMSTPAYNFPGLDLAFNTRNITVQVGDEFGHPVFDGTTVYFNSAHGTMTKDSLTTINGFVTNTLYSANPLPQGKDTLTPDTQILNYYPSTKGFSRVYASTIGKNGQWIKDSLLFLWTGKPIFANTGVDTFTIANGGSSSPFTFKIVDRFGHPMSEGTTITVTASAGKISGDISRTILDTFIGGAGVTTFSVILSDSAPADTTRQRSDIMVTVNHPIYGVFQFPLAGGVIN